MWGLPERIIPEKDAYFKWEEEQDLKFFYLCYYLHFGLVALQAF